MDEILRARKLTEEILARAASIKTHMAQVSKSMANMALIEEETKTRAARTAAEAAKPPLRLMDLPDDLLRLVAAWAGAGAGCGAPGSGAASLAALAITCRRWQLLAAREPGLWEDMCRRRWGVTERDPAFVPVLDPRQLHLAAGWPVAAVGSGIRSSGATGVLAGVRGGAGAGAAATAGRTGRLGASGPARPLAGKTVSPASLGASGGGGSGASRPGGSPARLRGAGAGTGTVAAAAPPSAAASAGSRRHLLPALTPPANSQQPSPSRLPRAAPSPSPSRRSLALSPTPSGSASLLAPLTIPSPGATPGPSPGPSPSGAERRAAADAACSEAAGAGTDLRVASSPSEWKHGSICPTGPASPAVQPGRHSPTGPTHGSPSAATPSLTSPRVSSTSLCSAGSVPMPAVGPRSGSQLPPLLPGGDALEPVPLGCVLRRTGPGAGAGAGWEAGGGQAGRVSVTGGNARQGAMGVSAEAAGGLGRHEGGGCGGGGRDGVDPDADADADARPMSPRGGGGVSAAPNLWQLVYRDRLVGWRGVLAVFRWLQSHGCPGAVSGSLHRQQLLLALRYLHIGIGLDNDRARAGAGGSSVGSVGRIVLSGGPEAEGARGDGAPSPGGPAAAGPRPRLVAEALAAELLTAAPDMVPCLLALLSNDSGLVVELAAAGLADLLALDQDRLAEEREGQRERERERQAAEAARQRQRSGAAAAGSGGRGDRGGGGGGGKGGAAAAAVARPRRDEPGIVYHVLLASNSGRSIASQLRDGVRSPGIVRQITRCLVNLWGAPPVPRVLPLRLPPPPAPQLMSAQPGGGGSVVPPLEDGVWQLQEFSARGDPLRLIHTVITFRPGVTTPPADADLLGDPRVSPRASEPGLAGGSTAPWGLPPPTQSSLIFPSGPVLYPAAAAAAAGTTHGTVSHIAAGGQRQSWAGEQLATAATAAAAAAAAAPYTSYPLLPLVGPDGRPVGGTAAALVALGGGTGARWGGGRPVVELLGGGYDVMLPRGAMMGLAAVPVAAAAAAPATGSGSAYPSPSTSASPSPSLDREAEEFRLSGWLDPASGEWHLQRRCVNVPFALSYKGYSDAHGCWGTYTVQQEPGGAQGPQGAPAGRAAAAAAAVGPAAGASAVRGPRVFRLFRDPSLAPPDDLIKLLAAMQDSQLRQSDGAAVSGGSGPARARAAAGRNAGAHVNGQGPNHQEVSGGGEGDDGEEDPDLPHLEPLYG